MLQGKFLTKQGETALAVANFLIGLKLGARLPNISDLCAKLGVGAGTVQAALKMLEDSGEITLQSRGHQGTVITGINRVGLWKLTENAWISCSMPLPYTRRFEGLATALYRQFDRAAIPFNISFVRGGRVRIKRLVEGRVNFTICSKMTAELAKLEFPELEILFDFGAYSYIGKSGLVFSDERNTRIRDGMRIAVDKYSYDHQHIVEMICREYDVELIDVKYSDIFSRMEAGEVDATVWNWDELIEKYHDRKAYTVEQTPEMQELIRDSENAVLVVMGKNARDIMLLGDIIDCGEVKAVQKEVIDGRRIPSY